MKETRPILGLSAAHLVTDIYSPVLPAILPLLILENGYSYLMAGLIITVWNLTSSFTQPFIGYAYDRKGLQIPLSLSVLIAAVFISAIGWVDQYAVILIFAAVAALGHAFFHPIALGMVARLAGDRRRGRLTAYFTVGGNLGFALGPVFAGAIVSYFGLHGLLLLVIPGLLAAAVLYFVLPPSPPPAEVSGTASDRRTGRVYKGIALLVIASAFRAWVIFSSVAYLPTFLAQSGLDVVTANLLVTGMLLAGVAGQILGGSVSDRYGRKEYTLFGLAASLPPFAVFLASDGLISLVALIIFGFFLWSTFSVTVAMAHEMVPGNAGLVSGLMLGLSVGAGGAGVAVIGWLADTYALDTAFAVLAIPIVVAFALFLFVPYPWRIARALIGNHR